MTRTAGGHVGQNIGYGLNITKGGQTVTFASDKPFPTPSVGETVEIVGDAQHLSGVVDVVNRIFDYKDYNPPSLICTSWVYLK